MATSVNALSGLSGTTSTGNATSAAAAGSTAPSEEVFLNLLVAQIKNQDPLNPTDSTQFVSQLAQFSELEQVIAIRADEDKLSSAATQSAATQGTATQSPTIIPTTSATSAATQPAAKTTTT